LDAQKGVELSGKPEYFEKLDVKYKMTLLQMEKRFVDLETAISDLNQRMKDINFDAVTAVQQHVDDIEDLLIVEQAGIMELKKMMGDASQKFESQVSLDTIGRIEQSIARLQKELAAKKVELPTDLLAKVDKLQSDVVELSVAKQPDMPSVNLDSVEGKLAAISNEVMDLKSSIDLRIKRVSDKVSEIANKQPEKPGMDFDFLAAKIESVKSGIDILSDKKVETDLKIGGIEEKIKLLENRLREAVSQKIFDEIKSNKRDIMGANIRMDTVEKILKEVNLEMQELSKTVKKFESFEKLSLLSKDVEEKLERFRFVEDEIRRLSQRVEMVYENIDQDLVKLKSSDRNYEKISASISELRKEFERNRLELHRKADAGKINEVDRKVDQTSTTMNERVGIIEEYLKNKTAAAPNEEVINRINNINRKLESDFQKFKKFENDIEMIKGDIGKKVGEAMGRSARNIPQHARSGAEVAVDIKRVLDELKATEDQIGILSKQLANMEGRMRGMQTEMEKKIGKVQQIASAKTDIDAQIGEMINKIVFLESRLGTVEGVVQKTQESMQSVKNIEASMQKTMRKVQQSGNVQPVIIE
jgi:chromosome segregation ATPase